MNTYYLLVIITVVYGMFFLGSPCDVRRQNKNVVLLILKFQKMHTTEKEVYGEFQLQIFNNQQKEVAVLKEFRPGSNGEPTHSYNIYITHNDTAQYYFSEGFLDKARIPIKSDYIVLKKMDSLLFSFKIVFSKLSKDPINYSTTNKDDGVYKIFVEYYDVSPAHSKAIRERIKSNLISIKYDGLP